MASTKEKTAIIFGGTGFIGLHFARYLLDEAGFDRIVLADIKPPDAHKAHRFVSSELASGIVIYQPCDVRFDINKQLSAEFRYDLIANFAAVHREPGHEPAEYYLTNLPGAENVCRFADAIGCNELVFTSSISPYGPSETQKDEEFTPTPETAYGGSKLTAEWIHRVWQGAKPDVRRLLIVRPGVVFGPGEGGNVSRLVNAISRGFFVYAGNRQTRKAGIYVRELCHAIWWCLRQSDNGVSIYNISMDPGPSVEEYVNSVEKALGKTAVIPTIPSWLLLFMGSVIGTLVQLFRVNSSINYVRVRKLIRSNNIIPLRLREGGYTYRYTLLSAMEDWRKAMPEEWTPSSNGRG